MEGGTSRELSVIEPELYFLILKFLSSGEFQETAKVFGRELEKCKILPKRLDWEGNEHERSFEELEAQYPHIGPDHLLRICGRIGPILDKEIPPNVNGVLSLLGAGRQSLLRKGDEYVERQKLEYYAARRHWMPFVDPIRKNFIHNIVNVLGGREFSGPVPRNLAICPHRYSQQKLLRCTLGHLSAVYCLLFDRTGRYILTGADDLLIKLWSALDGRLLATFRGASAEIADIDINLENTLLAAGSIDKVLRVWDLQTGSPVAVLVSHTGMITSVNFCPSNRWDVRYLVTTSTDGSVAFWTYSYANKKPSFVSKPIQYHEKMRPGQAQMICSAFSPGGMFLATGSADHHVRVYSMHDDEGPRRILEVEAHTDAVDSIQWAHQGLRFVSGSKDGTANIWHFESTQWKNHQLLMNAKLPGVSATEEEQNKKLRVTMVSWNSSDTYVITAVNDHSIKVWDSFTGKLLNVLTGPTDEMYVLESNPKDPNIVLSAGHDGLLFIWNIEKGTTLAQFTNSIEGQGNGAVFDAKWSPDGSMFAATDAHGHILTFGFGAATPRMELLPKELFFHTDYRPLVRDNNHWVLDEQTQVAPHLMPPPFLVDVEGNPYPPMLQRLVPGREHCQAEQLVPNILINAGGRQEVIEGLPDEQPRSGIDRMIEALAQRRNLGDTDGNGNEGEDAAGGAQRPQDSPRPALLRLGSIRRSGDVEGVRQSTGNWHKDPNAKWNKRVLVEPLTKYALERARSIVESIAQAEMDEYKREMRRRPVMITTMAIPIPNSGNRTRNCRRRNNNPRTYRTRAARNEQLVEQQEQPEQQDEITPSNSSEDSGDSSAHEDDLMLSGSSSDSSESSGYSDWVAADHGVNLEPPKRSKRKPVRKRPPTPPSDPEKKKTVNKKAVHHTKLVGGEVPEIFRPSEWLSEVIPRKAPYYPQMGDEVVYFRQGHQLYIDAVRTKKVYEIAPKTVPWLNMDLREQELVKVVGIKYEIKPPRLCCLKLALLDESGHLTGDNFTIKYHDMADVLDFLVLKQFYDTALARNWSINDKFRCMIDDGWWIGEIISRSAYNDEFPDSLFMCYQVRWDNGELERMSPWDLEPVNPDRLPANVGGAVPVLPEEIQSILYQPQTDEWPRGDREASCRRFITGLDQVMSLAIAEPFMAPVDLNLYPTYAFVVEYPIDLSTIKARFENHFYRRITSAQFDVRYLATNAEKFNEGHSPIVKQARIITELCLRIIKNYDDIDVPAVYHQLVDTYESSESEVDVESYEPSTSGAGPSTSRAGRQLRSSQQPLDWRQEAKTLLDALIQCKDSAPFREPVDRLEHPDYYQVIDTPIDLGSIREDLLGGNYETPLEFSKDMRLLFTNSRTYNTNKRSRIYTMTIRLSAMFEEHIRKIIYNWKSSRRRNAIKNRKPSSAASPQNRKQNRQHKRVTRYNGTRPPNQPKTICDDSDEDDSDAPIVRPRVGTADVKRFLPSVNGHPSTSSQPGPSRTATSSSVVSAIVQDKQKAGGEDSNDSSSSSSDSSTPTSEPDSDPVIHLKSLGKRCIRKKTNYDSEDSYKPNSKQKGKKAAKQKSSRHKSESSDSSEPLVNLKNKNKSESFDRGEDSDDSDDEPLINHRINGAATKSSHEDENSQSSSRSRNVKNYFESDEDDRPLKRTYRGKRKLSSDTEFNLGRSRKSTKRKMSTTFSESQGDDDEEEDDNGYEEEGEFSRHSRQKPSPKKPLRLGAGVSGSEEDISSKRSRRPQQKRPKYNENSDDESDEFNPAANNNNRRRPKFRLRNFDDENDDDDEVENGMSRNPTPVMISSRGRVCRMTERARAAFLGE